VDVGEILVERIVVLALGTGEGKRGEEGGHLVSDHNHLDAQVSIILRGPVDGCGGAEQQEVVRIELVKIARNVRIQVAEQIHSRPDGQKLAVQIGQGLRGYGRGARNGCGQVLHCRNTPFFQCGVTPYWALTI